jgi:hypothetical protein
MDHTKNLNSPGLFRQWTAISTLAAVLEQKVWVMTSRPVYPNLYIFLIGHPGVGKSRTIYEGRAYVQDIPEFYLAPISLTWAALVDRLVKSKRKIVMPDNEIIEYNSMYICADELGAFIHKHEHEMVDGLSAFFNPTPYSQERRYGEIKINIPKPQLNMLCGSTPQNLMEFMPEKAWGQGFTSRTIMVFADEKIISDDFAPQENNHFEDLTHDLLMINDLRGQFEVTADYRDCVWNWKQLGEPPVPSHPRLIHYAARRVENLYKLSMISAIDKSNSLILTREDFNQALNWLVQAEITMPDIFKAGATNADAQAMDEIIHHIMISDKGQGVSEANITRFAKERIPIHSIMRVVEILERSGQITCIGREKRSGIRWFQISKGSEGQILM